MKIFDHGIDRRRFSGSRTSCENHNSIPHSRHDRIFLLLIKLHFGFFFNLMDLFFDHYIGFFIFQIQIMQHFRGIEFQIIEVGHVYPQTFFRFFEYDLLFHRQIHQVFLNILNLHFQKCRCPTKQHVLCQIDMPFGNTLL